jgi:hypothetical protein
MKNNLNSNLLSRLNSQWQGFIDFMADGVADVGLERSSLVDKYLNELVNTNNPSNARAIESVVKARVINELLHFTPIDNLEQILKYGFIPRIYLQNSKILRATFPDSSRDDGNKHCYCMSISWPNYKMFDVKRREMGGDWVVIKINPKAVINNECFFYKTNAGSYLGRKVGAGGIEDMFFDQKFREQLEIPDSFTTDPQAEVQSESRIPADWIDEIHVRESNSTSRYVRMLLKNANLLDKIKIVVDRRYFDKRKDYKYWQRAVA